MVLAGPYGCVGMSLTTYLKKYFLAWYLKLFIRTHCALELLLAELAIYVERGIVLQKEFWYYRPFFREICLLWESNKPMPLQNERLAAA